MKWQDTALIITSIIIILLGYQFYSQINSLNEQISGLNQQQTILTNDLNDAKNIIITQEQTISSLEESYNNALDNIKTKDAAIKTVESELGETKQSLEQTETKIADIKTELDSFEGQVYDSLNWFKKNTDIQELKEYEDIRKYIRSRCIQEFDDSCNLKLACLSHINDQIHGFKYKADEETSQTRDKLQNLSQFAQSKGGDCEDYSLLVAAEINYAKSYCEDQGIDEFTTEAVEYTGEDGVWYAIDNFEKWGFMKSRGYDIPKEYKYHYIVCGNYPSETDPNLKTAGGVSGHCAIAFTDKQITDSSSISSALSKMIVFEPQSGFLTFDNRLKTEMNIPSDGLKNIPFKYYIWAIITAEDYYIYKQYNNQNQEWKGYNDFLPEINLLKEQIQ